MGMLDSRAAPRKGMLSPAALQRMQELQSLLAADPTGTGMMTAQPANPLPGWQQFSQANPVPLNYTGMPPGAPPGPPQPGMPPPGGMGLPPAGGPMPTYSQQMDQAQQPPMPPAPQIAPGEPGEAAAADPFFQALAGRPLTYGGCGGPQPDLLPNTASIVSSPSVSRATPPKRRATPSAGQSEADRLTMAALNALLARRKGRA